MEFTGVGGGVMLAAAAVLWLVYLMPTWFRRREYLATERNAVRLQQTLRLLAETAEVPEQVRAATSARSIAQHEKALRDELRRADAVARSRGAQAARQEAARSVVAAPAPRIDHAARAAGTPAPARTTPAARAAAAAALPASLRPASSASRRVRRTRSVLALLALAALITVATQLVLFAVTGVSGAGWTVLGAATLATVSAVSLLARLAAVSRRRVVRPAVARRTSLRSSAPVAERRAEAVDASWTPVPVPKPLYLSREQVIAAAVTVEPAPVADPAADLRAAAEVAERALREAERAVTPLRPAVSPAGAPSRFSAMGVVDADTLAAPNLDEVLRRRRA